ncbi:MAG TPA: 3-oxoacyl-[acyl-carrier-protein] synthase III C-terminal domain-containing protein [Steroidobacteraceae bacterium]|nr:3-oxoacyl-[acyl-carrier-protein] synthase III C-terminal domain-containing protein [Steroidobacteraceae bacterium]
MNAVALEILGTGEYVPATRVASSELDRRWNKPARWTEEQTGVVSRAFVSGGENVISMGVAAARAALADAHIAAAELDAVVAVGSVPAQAIPCTAAFFHRELGLASSGIAAFDINATCLGFLAALDLLAPAIAAGRYRHVLVIASEVASVGLDWNDPLTAGLFGDGAGAVVLSRSRNPGASLLAARLQTFSAGVEHCQVQAGGTLLDPRTNHEKYVEASYFRMKGRATYRLAAALLPNFLESLARHAGIELKQIDTWITHQASGRALRHLQKLLLLPPERFVLTLPTHGNQISASLPVALHRARHDGRLQPGQYVALIGSGAGLSIGGAILKV